MKVNHGTFTLFKVDTLISMSQQECTKFFDVHFLALLNKSKGLPVIIQQHTMLAYGGSGGGAVCSRIVSSHFELCSRASTSEFLFPFLVGCK